MIGLFLLGCAFAAVLVYPREPMDSHIFSNDMTSKKEAMDKSNDMEKHKSESPLVVDSTICGRRMLGPSWRDEQKLSYGAANLGETGGT